MSNAAISVVQSHPKKSTSFLSILKICSSIALLLFAILGMVAGMRFLMYLDRLETYHVSAANKWSDTGFQQLQQMNGMLEKELNLILEQRQENLGLQKQIQELKASLLSLNKKDFPSPNIEQPQNGEKR